MGNDKILILIAVLFTLFIFLTGFWLRGDGKPYSSIILTIHKLISLAAVVVLGIAITRLNKMAGLSTDVLAVAMFIGLLFVVTVLSRGIWSIEKTIPAPVVWVHQVSPFLTLLSTAVTHTY